MIQSDFTIQYSAVQIKEGRAKIVDPDHIAAWGAV